LQIGGWWQWKPTTQESALAVLVEMTRGFPTPQAQAYEGKERRPLYSIHGTDSAVLGIVNSQDPVNPTLTSAAKTGKTLKYNISWRNCCISKAKSTKIVITIASKVNFPSQEVHLL
jgi:hypothetical protein